MEKWRIPKKVLKENYKEYRFDLSSLDVSGIPRDDLDIALNDAIYLVEIKKPDNEPVFGFKIVNEGLIKTFPANRVRKSILHKFPELDPKQIQIIDIPEGGEKIQVEDWIGIFLPDMGDNLKRFTDVMKTCGYTFQKAIKHGKLGKWQTLYFSPNFQVPRNMDDEPYLWHISPKVLEKSILEKGFVPYSKNSKFRCPDRIYFFKGSLPKDTVVREGIKLYEARVKEASERYREYVDLTKYVLYKVALYRMSGINFYVDPDWSKLAVYTTQNISPSFIESREDIDYGGI